jgi:hypothetical protein
MVAWHSASNKNHISSGAGEINTWVTRTERHLLAQGGTSTTMPMQSQ